MRRSGEATWCHRGQVIIEDCVLSALLMVGLVVFWKTLMRDTPGQLNQSMQKVIRCIVNSGDRCR